MVWGMWPIYTCSEYFTQILNSWFTERPHSLWNLFLKEPLQDAMRIKHYGLEGPVFGKHWDISIYAFLACLWITCICCRPEFQFPNKLLLFFFNSKVSFYKALFQNWACPHGSRCPIAIPGRTPGRTFETLSDRHWCGKGGREMRAT